MQITIELFNSSDCSLEARSFDVAEGDHVDSEITRAMRECLKDWIMSPGDTIKISELT